MCSMLANSQQLQLHVRQTPYNTTTKSIYVRQLMHQQLDTLQYAWYTASTTALLMCVILVIFATLTLWQQ
jgi:hypothetical protein